MTLSSNQPGHFPQTGMSLGVEGPKEQMLRSLKDGPLQALNHIINDPLPFSYSTNGYYDDPPNLFNTTWNDDIQENYFNNSNITGLATGGGWNETLGWGDVALVSLFCAIIAGTVAGNTLVIAAVLTTRRLRTVTNCFVMSLAVADWLVGVFVMPPKVALHLVHNEWRLGGIVCELWISLDVLLCTASILSLCAISIDRYLAITRPLAYSRRRRSKRLALSMISCVWVAAIVITSPPIFGWYEEDRNHDNKCEYNENTGYVVYSALGSFFLPLLVMLYVYARIACVIARRQNSIQRLHNSSDKKPQCCGGSDAEEPLNQRDVERQASYDRREGAPSNAPAAILTEMPKYPDSIVENCQHQGLAEKRTPIGSLGGSGGSSTSKGDAKDGSFWQRLRRKTCTSGNDDSPICSSVKGKSVSSGEQKSGAGSSDSDSNSASGIAIALPDPATLSGGVVGGAGGGVNDSLTSVRSACSSPGNLSQHTHHQSHPHHHHPNARLRTGSRLCHHSLATTSPQRNIHRVHQTASSTTRLFVDNEIVPLEASKGPTLSKSTPRVWTVEEISSSVHQGGSGSGRAKSPNGRATSFKLDKNSRGNSRFNSTTLTVPTMNNSPAGNPASLMSSQNVSSSNSLGGGGGVSGCDNNPTLSSSRMSNRIYHNHPQANQNHYHNHHHHQHPPVSNMTSIHRGRSLKLTLNLHGNDHNQNNGGTIARDFSSGRVASFKRETKTAQTLAAVVGGFIICWLPFFVAYVIGPFISDDSEPIPTALMDFLIWLGWSNSTINPFIYAFYSPDFRSAFWRLTLRKCSTLLAKHRNTGRRSPRRYDDHNNTHSRVSG